MDTRTWTCSESGRRARPNEDCIYTDPAAGVWIVADGIGGRPNGRAAAATAVAVLAAFLKERRYSSHPCKTTTETECGALRAALCEVAQRISAAGRHTRLEGMGATIVCGWLAGGRLYVGNLGDSRAYLWSVGCLRLLSRDHNVAQLLVESGNLAPPEAALHPSRRQLTQYCGMCETPRPDVCEVHVRNGDVLLLCSDGLTSWLNPQFMTKACGGANTCGAHDPARELINVASAGGATDDLSAILVRFQIGQAAGRSKVLSARGPILQPPFSDDVEEEF